jgi:uncharacterized membrane protein YccC
LVIERWGIDAGHIRRGLQFLLNLGTPLVVGVARGESQTALAAVVVGLAFGFADTDGPLLSRWRFLALDTACIALGAGLGYASRSHPPLLWPFFIAITLGVGVAPLTGRLLPLTGRHAAMAFTIVAVYPASFSSEQVWYVLGMLPLAFAGRTIDHLVAGRLPRQPAPALQLPSGQAGWLRFALAFAGAATAALWIGKALEPTHIIWVVVTTLVVMQADARMSYRRIVERIAGTFAGVVVAWIITVATQSPIAICICILLVLPFIPHHLANRYWLHTALIALVVLLVYDLAELNARGISQLLMERVVDMLLGCAVALVGTAAAFPRVAVAELDSLVEEAPVEQQRRRGEREPAGDEGTR